MRVKLGDQEFRIVFTYAVTGGAVKQKRKGITTTLLTQTKVTWCEIFLMLPERDEKDRQKRQLVAAACCRKYFKDQDRPKQARLIALRRAQAVAPFDKAQRAEFWRQIMMPHVDSKGNLHNGLRS